LLPAFLIGGDVLAWRCSACNRLFSVAVELATSGPALDVLQQFSVHPCSAKSAEACNIRGEAQVTEADKKTTGDSREQEPALTDEEIDGP
jgi:hypothetical protein